MSGAAKRADQGGRRGARGVVRAVAVRYPVGSFVVLAFVVSWAAWGPLLADRQGWVTWSASTYLHLLRARAFACRWTSRESTCEVGRP